MQLMLVYKITELPCCFKFLIMEDFTSDGISSKVPNQLNIYFFFIIIRVFCPRAGLSEQTQESRLQFCPKADLPPQT